MTALRFFCRQCRKQGCAGAIERVVKQGRTGAIERVVLTGKQKRYRVVAGVGPLETSRQYKCLDCGHVGWSSHADLTTAAVAT